MADDEDADPVPVRHGQGRQARGLAGTLARRLQVVRDPDMNARPAIGSATTPVQAVIHVRLAPAASRRQFEQYVQTIQPVVRAWQVTGDVDYELLVSCPAVPDLDGALSCLRRCGGIEVTSVGLVLREVSGPGAAGLTGHLVPATRDGRLHEGR
jgi:hypothetical protein